MLRVGYVSSGEGNKQEQESYLKTQDHRRRSYRMLIDLFLPGRGHQNIPTERALEVFHALTAATDGEILKKDIFGISAASPSLSPPISTIGVLELLEDQKTQSVVPPGAIAHRFQGLDSATAGAVARHFDQHYNELAPWKKDIEEAVIKWADSSTLSQPYLKIFALPSFVRVRI